MTDAPMKPLSPAAPKANETVVIMAMVAVLAALPLLGVYPYFVMQALCFALFACAFNLLIGFVGLLSFGHAMFLGTAGYASAHAAKVWGLAPEVCIIFGTVAAGVLGLLVGLIAIRRHQFASSPSSSITTHQRSSSPSSSPTSPSA